MPRHGVGAVDRISDEVWSISIPRCTVRSDKCTSGIHERRERRHAAVFLDIRVILPRRLPGLQQNRAGPLAAFTPDPEQAP